MRKNKKEKPELQNWYKDRYQSVIVQRKLLAVLTLASLACTFVTIFTLSRMLPLKTIEPYVIQIDSTTGITQMVDPLTARELTANEAVNNYFLVQYIRSREGYTPSSIRHQYNLVRLMSENSVIYPRFVNQASPNNPDSNISRLGTTGSRTVKFKSITYLRPKVAQMRVVIEETGPRGRRQLHRLILIAFEYVKMNLSPEERYLNPLGFRVTDYQINEDLLQP